MNRKVWRIVDWDDYGRPRDWMICSTKEKAEAEMARIKAEEIDEEDLQKFDTMFAMHEIELDKQIDDDAI